MRLTATTSPANEMSDQNMIGCLFRVSSGHIGASEPVRNPTVSNAPQTATKRRPLHPVQIAVIVIATAKSSATRWSIPLFTRQPNARKARLAAVPLRVHPGADNRQNPCPGDDQCGACEKCDCVHRAKPELVSGGRSPHPPVYRNRQQCAA